MDIRKEGFGTIVVKPKSGPIGYRYEQQVEEEETRKNYVSHYGVKGELHTSGNRPTNSTTIISGYVRMWVSAQHTTGSLLDQHK